MKQIPEPGFKSKGNIASGSFSARLEQLLVDRGLRQRDVARMIGVDANRLSEWKNGKAKPQAKNFRDLAAALGVDANWLLTGDQPRTGTGTEVNLDRYEVQALVSAAPAGRLIKVASWAQAGLVTDYDEIAPDWQLEISTDCPDADAVGVQLRGDSMLPIYQEGDVVIMMPSREPRTGCLVVAKLRDEGVCFKLYAEPKRGEIRLSSYNDAYSPIERRRDDFEWICPVFETRRNVWR